MIIRVRELSMKESTPEMEQCGERLVGALYALAGCDEVQDIAEGAARAACMPGLAIRVHVVFSIYDADASDPRPGYSLSCEMKGLLDGDLGFDGEAEKKPGFVFMKADTYPGEKE